MILFKPQLRTRCNGTLQAGAYVQYKDFFLMGEKLLGPLLSIVERG